MMQSKTVRALGSKLATPARLPIIPKVAPPSQPLAAKAASTAYVVGTRLAQQQKRAVLEQYLNSTFEQLLEKAAAVVDVTLDDDALTKEAALVKEAIPWWLALPALYGAGRGIYDLGKTKGWWGKPENPYLQNIQQMAEAHKAALAAGTPWLSPSYHYGSMQRGAGGGSGVNPALWGSAMQRTLARMRLNPADYMEREQGMQDIMAGLGLGRRHARAWREIYSQPMFE
jgi:hypothetical protein